MNLVDNNISWGEWTWRVFEKVTLEKCAFDFFFSICIGCIDVKDIIWGQLLIQMQSCNVRNDVYWFTEYSFLNLLLLLLKLSCVLLNQLNKSDYRTTNWRNIYLILGLRGFSRPIKYTTLPNLKSFVRKKIHYLDFNSFTPTIIFS